MDYQEFLCVVEKKMNQRLKGGITASIHIAVKNNGRIKKGIMIENPKVNISPTIYLEEFYGRFQKGESMEHIVCDLIDFYEAVKYEESWDTSKVERYEAIQDKIVYKIIHTEENKELLREIPHIDMLDLSVVFYILLEVKKDGTATMLIRKEHLEIWGVEEEELFPLACKNAQRILPARLFMMKEIVEEILNPEFKEPQNVLDLPELFQRGRIREEKNIRGLSEETTEMTEIGGREQEGKVKGREEEEDMPDVMFVLTNSCRSYGAACLLYPDIMEVIGTMMGENFYILPSSIHELILVPQSKGLSKPEMEELVKEVNETQVKDEDQLSEHVYYYDKEIKKLFIL